MLDVDRSTIHWICARYFVTMMDANDVESIRELYKDLYPIIVVMRCVGGNVFGASDRFTAGRLIHLAYCSLIVLLTLFCMGRVVAAIVAGPFELDAVFSLRLALACLMLHSTVMTIYNVYAWRQLIPFIDSLSQIEDSQYHTYQTNTKRLVYTTVTLAISTPLGFVSMGIIFAFYETGYSEMLHILAFPWNEPPNAFRAALISTFTMCCFTTGQYTLSFFILLLSTFFLKKEFCHVTSQLREALEEEPIRMEEVSRVRQKHVQLADLVEKMNQISVCLIGFQVVFFILVACLSVYTMNESDKITTLGQINLIYAMLYYLIAFLIIFYVSVSLQSSVSGMQCILFIVSKIYVCVVK